MRVGTSHSRLIVNKLQDCSKCSLVADYREKRCSYLHPMYIRFLAVTVHSSHEAVFTPFRPEAELELSHHGLLGARAAAFPGKIPMVQGTPESHLRSEIYP